MHHNPNFRYLISIINKFFLELKTNFREKLVPAVRDIENVMREREEQIEETKVQMNTVEDRVFKDFCKKIGVKNIRQYEERELGKQQERLKRRVEYENNINRVSTQLEYERKREEQLRTNVDKFERMVQDIEDQLEAAKSTEQSQMQHIDTGKIILGLNSL